MPARASPRSRHSETAMKQITWMMTAFSCGVLVGWLALGQLPEPSRAQRAMLDGYLQAYCHPDRTNVQKAALEAAIFSRLTVSVGLGARALAEYDISRVQGACT